MLLYSIGCLHTHLLNNTNEELESWVLINPRPALTSAFHIFGVSIVFFLSENRWKLLSLIFDSFLFPMTPLACDPYKVTWAEWFGTIEIKWNWVTQKAVYVSNISCYTRTLDQAVCVGVCLSVVRQILTPSKVHYCSRITMSKEFMYFSAMLSELQTAFRSTCVSKHAFKCVMLTFPRFASDMWSCSTVGTATTC